jgi:serine/threonine-protein kinase RsbW
MAQIVRAAAIDAGFDPSSVYEIETAADEAFSNIIDHAYCCEGIGTIELEILSEPEKLILHLRDHGMPFNPGKVKKPNTTAQIKDRKERGLGIHLMSCCMDEMQYKFESGINTLTLVKYKGPSSDD